VLDPDQFLVVVGPKGPAGTCCRHAHIDYPDTLVT
jgi:hypothetical protein